MKKRLKGIRSRNISDYFVFLGPGLLLAIAAAGESGLSEAIEVGAHFNFELIWAIALILIFKFAFVNGIARYTVSTGETFFDALRKLPGPKNWAVFLIFAIYLMEMIAFGGMLLYGGIFLDYLIPGSNYCPSIFAILTLMIILVLLWKESYERIEKTVIIIVVLMVLGIVYSLLEFNVPVNLIIGGINPTIPVNSLIPIMALMGAVGSGMNLVLYSVWLNAKLEGKKGPEIFSRFMKSVNLDLVLSFILVAAFTIIFISLGSSGFATSYLEHGEQISVDGMICQVLFVVSNIPYGMAGFLLFGLIIMFGATLSGMDGRSRALSSLLVSAFNVRKDEKTLYHLILIVFSVIIVGALFLGENNPLMLIHHAAAVASVMFAVFGIIVIYLNLGLPDYARGNRLWLTIMGIGCITFIYIALMLENNILFSGFPLIERLFVVAFILYVFSKTGLFRRLISGMASFMDIFWTIAIFGAISIYGTMRGIEYYGVIINFRDLGPMIAGLIGGPWTGGLAGLMGGAYRYSVGGWTSLSCFVATVVAGVIAGLFCYYYRGEITYSRAALLGIIVESLHILVILPLLTPFITPDKYINVVQGALTPMIISNIAGLLIFVYIYKDRADKLHVYRLIPWKKEKPEAGEETR